MEDRKNPEIGKFIIDSLEEFKGKGCFGNNDEDDE